MSAEVGRHRLGLLAITAISLFGALIARLWFLQVVEGPSLEAQVNRNATRTVAVRAPRGRILDRNGTVLVDNRQSIVVAIDAQKYDAMASKRRQALRERLAVALSGDQPPERAVTTKFLTTRLNDSRFDHLRPVPVVDDATPAQEVYLREQATEFPSVTVEHQTIRNYQYGQLAAHVLGYVGPLADSQWQALRKDNSRAKPYTQTDDIGKAGVEQRYESVLRGTPGQRVYEVDRSGRIIEEVRSQRIEPRPGDDLYLSLDARVQYKAEAALQGRLVASKTRTKAGALTVLDPQTGQVRAMASYPTYNPAELVNGISCPVWRDLQGLDRNGSCQDVAAEVKARGSTDKPISKLLNRATQGAYPPASTYKLATSYAALKLGMITPQTNINDAGSYRLTGCKGDGKGCVKHNSGNQVHGSVGLREALTVSSDVFFYKIGDEAWLRRNALGDDALQKYMGELGYGAKTGIDLPAESAGSVPTPKREAETAAALFKAAPGLYGNDPARAADAGRWRSGYSADLAIGQKVVATPLQIANAYASLANGGTLWTPTVLDHTTSANRPDLVKVRFGPKAIRRIDWGPGRQTLLDGFRGAVDPTAAIGEGTAWGPFKGFPFDVFPLAGKTGTAQTGEDANHKAKADNSVFVGFSLLPKSEWAASAMLEGAGFGASAAAPAVELVLEPIATGEINSFVVPQGGTIDPEQVAKDSANIGTTGRD